MIKALITSILIGFVIIGTSFHCPQETMHYTVTHFNIVFAPDLSNRMDPNLYPKPVNDESILHALTANIYPTILNYRRQGFQRDVFRVDFMSRQLINTYHANIPSLTIDFRTFETQEKRIGYIQDWKGYENNNLRLSIRNMEAEYTRVNRLAARNNHGADIWTYFNQNIDSRIVLPDDPMEKDDDGNTYNNIHKNVLILVTDGYMESDLCNSNYNLCQETINTFRTEFLQSHDPSLAHFYAANPKYWIKTANNPYLKRLEVLVMEMYDRSLRKKSGAASVQPTDMEIMRLFWTDWLKRSGVRHLQLCPVAPSESDAEAIILNFIGIRKN